MASYSWSSSDGSSGRGVEVPRDDGSVSSFPLSLLETEGSLGRGSSGSSSPVNSNNEDGLGWSVGQPKGADGSGDEDRGLVSIDVADEGDRLELPPIPGYE